MSKSKTLVAPEPLQIAETSVSRAYARILLQTLDGPGTEIAPLSLTVTGFGADGHIPEDPTLRSALDALLRRKGKRNVEDVAYTIFPQRLWQMAQGDRGKLFGYYRMAFSAYQAMNRRANGDASYEANRRCVQGEREAATKFSAAHLSAACRCGSYSFLNSLSSSSRGLTR